MWKPRSELIWRAVLLPAWTGKVLRARRHSLSSPPQPPDEAGTITGFILQEGKTGISPKSLPAVRDRLRTHTGSCDLRARVPVAVLPGLFSTTSETRLPADCALGSAQRGVKQSLFVLPPTS